MSQLLEPALVVRCRQADQQIVESVVPAVTLELNILMSSTCVSLQSVAEYKAKVNKDCQVKLDTDNWLPADW